MTTHRYEVRYFQSFAKPADCKWPPIASSESEQKARAMAGDFNMGSDTSTAHVWDTEHRFWVR